VKLDHGVPLQPKRACGIMLATLKDMAAWLAEVRSILENATLMVCRTILAGLTPAVYRDHSSIEDGNG